MNNGNLVGTGPFFIKEKSEYNIRLHLRNTNKNINEVESVVFSNKQDDLLKDDFDLSFDDPFKVTSKSSLKEINYNYLQAVVLMLNTKFEYFKVAKNRCTVANLIHLSFENSEYSWRPIELGLPFSWSITQVSTKKFKEENKRKTVNVEILYANSAAFFNEEINKEISSNLKRNNINVKFIKLSIKELIEKMKKGDFEAAVLGYVPDFPNSDSLLTPFIGSSQQYNFSGYSNKHVDKLLSESRNTTDKVLQNEIYKKVFLALSEECPINYLGTQKGRFWAKEDLHIPPFSSLGYHFISFKHVVLK